MADQRAERDDLSAPRTLADLVVRAARAHPTLPAIVTADASRTHAEVDAHVARVAHRLHSEGVRKGDRVVLSMHKTADSFVIIHALHRVGAVMVPVDPLMPIDAAERLFQAVGPVAFLADQATLQRFSPASIFSNSPNSSVTVLSIDGDDASSLAPLAAGTPGDAAAAGDVEPVEIEPDDPAYVIFTSGSTGVPKGIVHTHRSALAYAELAAEHHGLTSADRIAGMPPLHFDMSTLELYAAPLVGASIVPISSSELRFPATFSERSESADITVWYSVPFQLRQISERGALDQRDLSALRHVIYAGEPFPGPALASLMQQLPGVRFTNAYGPAETNVCTLHELDGPPSGSVPIGQAWGDVRLKIIDPEAYEAGGVAEVEDGQQGELWVSAASTMEGYLDRPDLTNERMVVKGEERWYRTGDLVTLDHTGVLWLAGRLDHQIKVRGTRLELEAIEAVLTSASDIAEAVVGPPAGGSTVEHLVAAVTLADGAASLDQRTLRRWCLARLPHVAVPQDVDVWPTFPLTSSGKIDRKAVRSALASPKATDTVPGPGSPTNGD